MYLSLSFVSCLVWSGLVWSVLPYLPTYLPACLYVCQLSVLSWVDLAYLRCSSSLQSQLKLANPQTRNTPSTRSTQPAQTQFFHVYLLPTTYML